MDDKKKNKSKMPDAPIRAPYGNIKGIGKMGPFTGGVQPGTWAPTPGVSNPVATFMKGWVYNSGKGSKNRG
jgi:hypothetical protein